MAKFKSRHQQSKHRLFSGPLKLIVLIGVVLVAALVLIPSLSKVFTPIDIAPVASGDRYYLPAETRYPIHHRKHYSLAYAEEHEQAAWVAYQITIDQLNSPNKVKRSDYFKDDIAIKTGSAQFADYKGSGFTKGHLVPAADRNFSIEAMEETFLMSNISPQRYHCNGAIWRELEEQTRDWARLNKSLYIVSGPILTGSHERIGRNRVTVPHAYFKALLDLEEPVHKGIAFIIPNEKSMDHLENYAMTIDALEKHIDLDLFYEIMPESLEKSVEADLNLSLWKFDENRFRRRVTKWNN